MIRRNPRIFIILAVLSFLSSGYAQDAELEPIVVHRVSPGSAADGPLTSVLTREEIKNIPANVPEDLLAYLGADVQTRGAYGVKSDISVNAGTFQQVLILVNGVRVNDAQTAHHNLDLPFSIDDIERVEMVPAAESVRFGPDGVGGAINFVLKKPAAQKSSAGLAYGNHGTFEKNLGLSYGAGEWRNRLSAFHVESDGSRYDTDYNIRNYFHSTAWEKEGAALYVDGGYNQKEFGAYDFYTPNRGYPSKEWTDTTFINTRGVFENNGLTLEPRVDYRRHSDTFVLTVRNPSAYRNRHRTEAVQAGGVVKVPLGDVMLPIGADYREERIESGNLGKHVSGHWNALLDPTWALGPDTSVHVTARVDSYTTFSEQVTGSLSFKHAFSDASDAYATVGRTMRVPTFTELYYSDPTTVGDASLKPEHALNFEAGWHKELSKDLDFSSSVFTRREYDTIDFSKLSSSDPKFIARNISRATAFGAQMSFKWAVKEERSFDLRYLYADKVLDDSAPIFKYGLNYTNHMVAAGWDEAFFFGRNRMAVVMKKKPSRRAWALVNDRFSVDIQKAWQVFLEVDNLGNSEYQEIDGIPEQGRMFKLGTQLTW